MRNGFKAAILAGLLATSGLAIAAPAANKLIDGHNPQAILALAKDLGAASLDKDDVGDPMITGQMDGYHYDLFFYDCEQGRNCNTVQFRATFEPDKKATYARMHTWNKTKRFGQAYLDDNRDAVLTWDINLTGGVTVDNWNDTMDTWGHTMDSFSRFLDE